jgi:hypothetical protein
MFGQSGQSQRYSLSSSSRPSGATIPVRIVTRGIDNLPMYRPSNADPTGLWAILRANAQFDTVRVVRWSISMTVLSPLFQNIGLCVKGGG